MNELEKTSSWENLRWISTSSSSSLNGEEIFDETNPKFNFPLILYMPNSPQNVTHHSVEVSSSKKLNSQKKNEDLFSNKKTNITKQGKKNQKNNPNTKHLSSQSGNEKPLTIQNKSKNKNKKKQKDKKKKKKTKKRKNNSKNPKVSTFHNNGRDSIKQRPSFYSGEHSVMHSFLLIQKNFEQLKRATDRELILIVNEIEAVIQKNQVSRNRGGIGINRVQSDNILINKKIQNNSVNQEFHRHKQKESNKNNKNKNKNKNLSKKSFSKLINNEKSKSKGSGTFQEGEDNYFHKSGNKGKLKFLIYLNDLLMITKEILRAPAEKMSSEKFEKFTDQVHRRCRDWGSDWPNKKISSKLLFNIARILRIVRSEESLPEYQLYQRLATTSTSQFLNSQSVHLLNNSGDNKNNKKKKKKNINNHNNSNDDDNDQNNSNNNNKNNKAQKNKKNKQNNKASELDKLKKEFKQAQQTQNQQKNKIENTKTIPIKSKKSKKNKNKIFKFLSKTPNKNSKTLSQQQIQKENFINHRPRSRSNFFIKNKALIKEHLSSASNLNQNTDLHININEKKKKNMNIKNDKEKKHEGENSSEHEDFYLLCRMCECLIRVDLLEEHSKYCIIANKSNSKLIICDERLKKIIEHIDSLLKKWKVEFDKNPNDKKIQWKVLILENFKIFGNW
ncbi:phosphotyrosine interaction domain-containing family member [Anaeramoeba flamelloides]|uniref:Phosphotyrosine interaction domain-containing family member n=1 Tax=Anaeramoeba flamelloides TaxID=1746091 RepID=A0AAV7ZYI6_9EUKA|nr:phosphotyrosine interaction domain-containing family member [Anaeramoeba flamelloides]